MKPLLHPYLVNGPAGDPALYVDLLFEHRALLFDLGDLALLAPRKILRLSHVFVSHAHMDHFIGFDRVLRICLGRDKALHLLGPPGFIAQVEHKLAAYTWNLVGNYDNDFTLIVSEWHAPDMLRSAQFHCRSAFARHPLPERRVDDGIVLEDEMFCVRVTQLDHAIPSLAFALEEKQHINVWKSRLDERQLPTGAWLRELKQAVLRGADDDAPFRIWWYEGGILHEKISSIGALKPLLSIVAGQKLAYVVDCAGTPRNAGLIKLLAAGADVLFIEAVFTEADRERAMRTHHLTARMAGEVARDSRAKRMVPFHYSARYSDDYAALEREAFAAFNDHGTEQ